MSADVNKSERGGERPPAAFNCISTDITDDNRLPFQTAGSLPVGEHNLSYLQTSLK